MMLTTPPRARLKALAQGISDGHGFAVPLAARFAARIQERDWDDFAHDPTQLANGLRDLIDALAPDGVPVTIPGLLTGKDLNLAASEHVRVSLEATARLRSSMGDRVALVACLPDSGSVVGGADSLITVSKEFLAAGADVILVLDVSAGTVPESLTSLGNIARFHQSLALGCDSRQGLAAVERIALTAPRKANGVAVTDIEIPRNVDLDVLEDWVDAVRG